MQHKEFREKCVSASVAPSLHRAKGVHNLIRRINHLFCGFDCLLWFHGVRLRLRLRNQRGASRLQRRRGGATANERARPNVEATRLDDAERTEGEARQNGAIKVEGERDSTPASSSPEYKSLPPACAASRRAGQRGAGQRRRRRPATRRAPRGPPQPPPRSGCGGCGRNDKIVSKGGDVSHPAGPGAPPLHSTLSSPPFHSPPPETQQAPVIELSSSFDFSQAGNAIFVAHLSVTRRRGPCPGRRTS